MYLCSFDPKKTDKIPTIIDSLSGLCLSQSNTISNEINQNNNNNNFIRKRSKTMNNEPSHNHRNVQLHPSFNSVMAAWLATLDRCGADVITKGGHHGCGPTIQPTAPEDIIRPHLDVVTFLIEEWTDFFLGVGGSLALRFVPHALMPWALRVLKSVVEVNRLSRAMMWPSAVRVLTSLRTCSLILVPSARWKEVSKT